ncbi:MAG TPA: hypothetical protein VGS41_00405 [Chthonomonadales bacterium]|nr:hypothetical protein [Chthonomonadales bacterium]
MSSFGEFHTHNNYASEDEQPELSIDDILDAAYDELDGFSSWLEAECQADARAAEQDCFNAETLIDYLANYHRTRADQINEFQLRWFLFSHYIRKASADPATMERAPESLRRFYLYLYSSRGTVEPEWMIHTLSDSELYRSRLEQHAALERLDEAAWHEGFREWCAELESELDARCLWLPREISGGMDWGDRMGWKEATLYEEANRRWQDQRAILLEEGMDFESVREHLLNDYLVWTETPQDRLDGQTPREVIFEERDSAPADE